MKKCIYCNKELTGRKLKYCNEHCKYRYLSIKNNTHKKFSKAQHLRMSRAGKAQSKGRVGCRFN